MWLPGGIIAACAYVDGKEGGGAPQLLLYPQYHLDNASLLARLPLKQARICRHRCCCCCCCCRRTGAKRQAKQLPTKLGTVPHTAQCF